MNNISEDSRQKASRGVILHNEGLLFMYRKIIRDDQIIEYYVTIGGACENDEDYVTALHRECMEEAGVEIEIREELMDYHYEDRISRIYICKNKNSQFRRLPLEGSPEAANTHSNNTYEIHYIPRTELENLELKPTEIKNKLIERGRKHYYID